MRILLCTVALFVCSFAWAQTTAPAVGEPVIECRMTGGHWEFPQFENFRGKGEAKWLVNFELENVSKELIPLLIVKYGDERLRAFVNFGAEIRIPVDFVCATERIILEAERTGRGGQTSRPPPKESAIEMQRKNFEKRVAAIRAKTPKVLLAHLYIWVSPAPEKFISLEFDGERIFKSVANAKPRKFPQSELNLDDATDCAEYENNERNRRATAATGKWIEQADELEKDAAGPKVIVNKFVEMSLLVQENPILANIRAAKYIDKFIPMIVRMPSAAEIVIISEGDKKLSQNLGAPRQEPKGRFLAFHYDFTLRSGEILHGAIVASAQDDLTVPRGYKWVVVGYTLDGKTSTWINPPK